MIIIVMETRKTRYARYRERIRNLPPDVFDDEGKFASSLNQKELLSLTNIGYSAGAISYSNKEGKSLLDLSPSEKKESPYSYYLHKKRVAWLVKIIILIVVLAGLAALYYFFVREV